MAAAEGTPFGKVIQGASCEFSHGLRLARFDYTRRRPPGAAARGILRAVLPAQQVADPLSR
jgi:hypothetical protein